MTTSPANAANSPETRGGLPYYSVTQQLPVYRKNLLQELEDHHDSLREILEKEGDVMNRSTNVKAAMTNWNLHSRYEGFRTVADLAIKRSRQLGTIRGQSLFTHECWGAVYKRGEHTLAHTHWPNLWSWCYYIDMPTGSAPLLFPEIPMEGASSGKILGILPKAGDLIIFPGWVKHAVPPCQCESARRMIAGNICHFTPPPA